MALIRNVANYLRRNRTTPTNETRPTPNEGLSSTLAEAAGGASDGSATAVAVEVEPKMMLRGGRSRSIAELQQRYDEVMGLVQKIGDHLDLQAERQVHVERVMERVPAALEILPELNRQNSRLLDVVSEYLDTARNRDVSLNDTLGRICDSSTHQSEVLGLLQQQLESNHQAARHMTDTLGEFRSALADLGDSNTRAVQVLSNLSAAAETREGKLEQMLGRTQKWMIAALCCCGVASVTALVIAVLTLTR